MSDNSQPVSAPLCPSCNAAIRLRDSFTFWNPWRYPCPHCGAVLEASSIQKGMVLAAGPVGLLVAAGAIYLRQHFKVGNAWLALYLLITVGVVTCGALASWSRTRFKVKEK